MRSVILFFQGQEFKIRDFDLQRCYSKVIDRKKFSNLDVGNQCKLDREEKFRQDFFKKLEYYIKQILEIE